MQTTYQTNQVTRSVAAPRVHACAAGFDGHTADLRSIRGAT